MLPLCKFPFPEAAAAAAERWEQERSGSPCLGSFCQGSLCRATAPAPSRGTGARPSQPGHPSIPTAPGSWDQGDTEQHLFIRRCRVWAQAGRWDSFSSSSFRCSQPKGLATNIPALRDDQSWAGHQAGTSLPFRNMFNQGCPWGSPVKFRVILS